jgi:hypothetical protein
MRRANVQYTHTYRVVAAVDIVAEEEVIGIWRLAADLKQLHQITELPMHVPAYCHRCVYLYILHALTYTHTSSSHTVTSAFTWTCTHTHTHTHTHASSIITSIPAYRVGGPVGESARLEERARVGKKDHVKRRDFV